jgi:hypothetical protein
MTSHHIGARLIEAAAARDFTTVSALLDPSVEFRALTPHKFLEAHGRQETRAILERWYGPTDVLEVDALDAGEVVDRGSVCYRIRWATEEHGTCVFEQHAYYDTADGRITRFDLVCSGDRQVVAPAAVATAG